MKTHIALLRGVNLAGQRMIAMADLRELLTALGFANPRTLLQSGNLVFESPLSAAELEKVLEKETKGRLGLPTEYFVRTGSDWQAIIDDNPFVAEAKRDPGHLVVSLFKDAPTKAAARSLEEAIPGREYLRVSGRHGYIVYPDGIGQSKLTTALIDRKLGTRVTARNWNTVLKLGKAAAP